MLRDILKPSKKYFLTSTLYYPQKINPQYINKPPEPEITDTLFIDI